MENPSYEHTPIPDTQKKVKLDLLRSKPKIQRESKKNWCKGKDEQSPINLTSCSIHFKGTFTLKICTEI